MSELPNDQLGPTPAQLEYAKLMAVRSLVQTMRQANAVQLDEMLYRLENSFKGRLILNEQDTATPKELAQALFASVLASALTQVDPTPPVVKFKVLDTLTNETIAEFASEQEARDFASKLGNVDECEIASVADLPTVNLMPADLSDTGPFAQEDDAAQAQEAGITVSQLRADRARDDRGEISVPGAA